jgi:ABC-type branched-subunit amino acid transport system ATPase component
LSDVPEPGLLEVDALEAGYDDARILRGVSLRAGADEIVAIIGPNGAGKSTLLKAVYGLVTHHGGAVRLGGADVTGLRPDRLTRRGLNYVPQTENVFPSLTLAENVRVSSLVVPKPDRRAAVEQVEEVFPLLRERPGQRAGTLSGGQRKLVALARALVTRPRLLLLDEPSAGLAPQAIDLVFEKLAEIRRLGVGIVMVEQNARRALGLADRGYVLDLGRNAIEGRGAELLDDPKVADLYLGGSATTQSSSTSTSTPSGMKPDTK